MRAGVEVFAKYGHFNSIYNLSGGDILKFDLVVQKTWNEVFTTLLYKKEQAQYLEKLQKIYAQKAKKK